MNAQSYPTAREADIALLLEGSYPFVRGGVSAWMHQIIHAFPQYRFAAIFLGSRPQDYSGPRYELPQNLVHLEVHYLFDPGSKLQAESQPKQTAAFENIRCLHDNLRTPNMVPMQKLLQDLSSYLNPKAGIDEQYFLHSQQSWDYITEQYEKYCTDPSFIDYFWTIRNMHKPLWQIAHMSQHIPRVKAVHTISTGYAGFLGALIHAQYHRPLILTEHGIYTKERHIDIMLSDIVREQEVLQRSPAEISYLRNLWLRFFQSLARLCYAAADPIISLFQQAQQRQIDAGAPKECTLVVPNGINVAHFSTFRHSDNFDTQRPIVGFVGRVVPIKDIKTLIRALSIIMQHIPKAQVWIMGPTAEDPAYAQECKRLIATLGITNKIKFFEHKEPQDIYPNIDLLILSSISESLPLVILESFAAGVPIVTTRVGACPELILGLDAEDKALGPAGRVVEIANPQALAEAGLELLQNSEQWQAARQSALARVQKYYAEKTLVERYESIYTQCINTHHCQTKY